MTVEEFKKKWRKELERDYPQTEIRAFFLLVFEECLGWNRWDVVIAPCRELKPSSVKKLEQILNRLKRGEPIQYVMGYTEFCGLRFKVSPDVLIPRFETEGLVQWVVQEQQGKKIKILDIGTGSGCIAISLAKVLDKAQVYAVDLSEQALAVARENAGENKVEVHFEKVDILNPSDDLGAVDVMVSNPPYVRLSERRLMHKNVLEYEPGLALYVEDDHPLIFYEKILAFAKKHLNKGGWIYFEINEFLKEELQKLMEYHQCKSIDFQKDEYGKWRMLKVGLG